MHWLPRGPAPLPMGTWIALAGTLGLSARHVRTSVQRLSQGDWLQASAWGAAASITVPERASGASPRANNAFFRRARRRTNQVDGAFWSWGRSCVPAHVANLSRELVWCGFGEIAPGVFAQHGMAPTIELQPLLDAHDAREHVLTLLNVVQGQEPVRPDARALRPDGHCAQRLLRGWQAFVQRYRTLADTPLHRDAKRAFAQRTQLVHEYRRLLQNHPELPFANDDTLLAVRHQARRASLRSYTWHCWSPASHFWTNTSPPSTATADPATPTHRRPARHAGPLNNRYRTRPSSSPDPCTCLSGTPMASPPSRSTIQPSAMPCR